MTRKKWCGMKQWKVSPMRCLWSLLPDQGAKILRVYGKQGVLYLPAELEGHPVTEIGAYCFASAEHLPENGIRETELQMEGEDQTSLRPAAGEALEQLYLPDSISVIDNLAFYNCKNLRRLQVGTAVRTLGSDVFMNCHRLSEIQIRCGIREESGLNAILSRISSEVEVCFLGRDFQVVSRLLYPEYTESYDEIAPAHIFGRNITGEGFRARQLFQNGVVQIERYDEIFEKVAAEETPLTSARMALYRLCDPVALREEQKEIYARHVSTNGELLGHYFAERRDLSMLHLLCREHYLEGASLDQVIVGCNACDWGEGSASLMKWKHQYGAANRRDRYQF